MKFVVQLLNGFAESYRFTLFALFVQVFAFSLSLRKNS